MYILILGSSRFEDVSTYRRLISHRKSDSWNDLGPWSHLRYWLACANPPRQRSRQRVYPLSCTGLTDAGEMTGLTRVRYTVGSIDFRVLFDSHHMQPWLHELCGMSYDQACGAALRAGWPRAYTSSSSPDATYVSAPSPRSRPGTLETVCMCA